MRSASVGMWLVEPGGIITLIRRLFSAFVDTTRIPLVSVPVLPRKSTISSILPFSFGFKRQGSPGSLATVQPQEVSTFSIVTSFLETFFQVQKKWPTTHRDLPR